MNDPQTLIGDKLIHSFLGHPEVDDIDVPLYSKDWNKIIDALRYFYKCINTESEYDTVVLLEDALMSLEISNLHGHLVDAINWFNSSFDVVGKCTKCDAYVQKETELTEYAGYCLNCDENLYEIEIANFKSITQ